MVVASLPSGSRTPVIVPTGWAAELLVSAICPFVRPTPLAIEGNSPAQSAPHPLRPGRQTFRRWDQGTTFSIPLVPGGLVQLGMAIPAPLHLLRAAEIDVHVHPDRAGVGDVVTRQSAEYQLGLMMVEIVRHHTGPPLSRLKSIPVTLRPFASCRPGPGGPG